MKKYFGGSRTNKRRKKLLKDTTNMSFLSALLNPKDITTSYFSYPTDLNTMENNNYCNDDNIALSSLNYNQFNAINEVDKYDEEGFIIFYFVIFTRKY